MRQGFTTGSCAAAAAKASAYMLFTGNEKKHICIATPEGRSFEAELLNVTINKESASCAVRKDGGDDPDVTTGALIFAKVSFISAVDTGMVSGNEIIIDGGEGVGRVTMPGLDQPIGNAAINSVPRRMIEQGVREVKELFDYSGALSVIISVPGGEEIAKKTFNQRLGIEGGISILGTSGIVEPMSEKAITDTIRLELRQKHTLGFDMIAVTPGNYGADFIKDTYGFNLDNAVKCSNYIGDTIDMAAEEGYKSMLLCGHIGKLIKVSGGIMNTHSKVADCRMELMSVSAMEAGIDRDTVLRILDCVSTDAALDIIQEAGQIKHFMNRVMYRIEKHLYARAADRFKLECMVFSNVFGLLGQTAGASELLDNIMHDIKNKQVNYE